MYIPNLFKQSNWAACEALIEANSFAQVISIDTQGELHISHLPVLYNGAQGELVFHLAAANPHCDVLTQGRCSVVFSAEHGYISPRWSQEVSVPTWNYRALHIHGEVEEVSEAEEKYRLMGTSKNL